MKESVKFLIEANETKRKLLSIISHELANQFNTILGFTSLLEQDYDTFTDKERKEYVSIINLHVNRNYKITKNLLNWSKSQQDGLVLLKKQINVRKSVLDCIKPYQTLACKKQLVTSLIIEDSLTVLADLNSFNTILINIYSNAIKFSCKGEIIIKAEKNKEEIKIQIIDQGVGFKKEKINSTLGTNNEEGSGVGLLIVKDLLDAHRGSLEISKNFLKGTIISLKFPLEK